MFLVPLPAAQWSRTRPAGPSPTTGRGGADNANGARDGP